MPDLVKHGRFSQGPTMVGCLVALCPSANTGGGGFSWPLYFSLYLCSEQAGWGDRAVYHYTYICIYTYIFKNQCRASSPSLVVHLLIDFMNRICCLFFNNYTSIVVCMEINIYIYIYARFLCQYVYRNISTYLLFHILQVRMYFNTMRKRMNTTGQHGLRPLQPCRQGTHLDMLANLKSPSRIARMSSCPKDTSWDLLAEDGVQKFP